MQWLGVLPLLIMIVWGGYSVWKKTRLDYSREDIYFTLTILVGAGVLGETAARFLGVSYWGMWLGGLLGLGWICKKKKWNFWEWWDDITLSLGGVGLVLASVWGRWAEVAVLVWSWTMAYIMGKYYRKIRWYPSGKPGITGIWYVIWLGVGLSLIAFVNSHTLYWVSLISLTGVIVLYYRSGLKVGGNIWRKLKTSKNP